MKNRWICLLLCVVMIVALTGCGSDKIEPAAVRSGEAFTVAVAQTPNTFNPYTSSGGLEAEFFLLCYDPLWRISEDGTPAPCLVEDYSLSSDKLTWTIRLRRDVTFSDGYALTAADVLYSYELMRHSPSYADYFQGVSAIRCPDDYTVVISTDYVKADLCLNPTPILPRHLWQSYDEAEFENTEMIGSGPFVYCPEESGEDGWMFRSRQEHFGQEAAADAVFFACYGTVTGAARALAAGEADASFGLSDVQLTTLEGVPGVELVEAMLATAECRGLAFNTKLRHTGKEAVRQAVEYCIDRDWFILMASGGTGVTGSSFVSPGAHFFREPSPLRGFDVNAARSVLASAGYADLTGDGKLQYKDSTPLTLTMYTSSRDAWASTAATILSARLEELGISVTWKKTDLPVEDVCTGKTEWDLCFVSWQGNVDAPLTASRFYSEISGLTGWTSEAYENDLERLRAAQEDAEALAFASQLQQLVYDECPVIVLSYGAEIQAIRNADWTGYETALDALGGLFLTGSATTYMNVHRTE